MNDYLTEYRLGLYLQTIYPSITFKHNITIKESKTKYRVDYVNDDLKMIVEFDGYQHYTLACQVLRDKEKDIIFAKCGYKTIRIPYFVQLSANTICLLFRVKIDFVQTYEHGFIDNKCILPADYCEIGIVKFIDDLQRFGHIFPDIRKSILNKIEVLGDELKVLPPSLIPMFK